MPDKPILFLDVDGVINVLPPADVELQQVEAPGGAWVPVGTRERLARLLEVFEPIWSTAWFGQAHGAFRGMLALDDVPWPYVTWLEYKLPAMIRVANNRPWAWVDDDAGWELKNLGWDSRHIGDNLIVVPDTRVGLTDDHVEQLLVWAANQ